MVTDRELLLDVAQRRGFLSRLQADECRQALSSCPDPMAWLVSRKFLAPDEAKILGGLVDRLHRDQELCLQWVREGSLTAEDARRLSEQQIRSVSAPRLAGIREAARQLSITIPDKRTPPVEAPRPVDRIGRYEVIRELGRGGMAVVYAARDPKLGRDVAIKVLKGLFDSRDLDVFFREAQVTARLRHPRIVTVFDVGEENGQPYFVMDLIEGKTLERALEEGMLSRPQGVRVVRQAAEAVAHAHAHGVLHRDLKPQNILVTPDGQAVVTDFGLAKMLDGEEPGLSLSGMPIGTPSYMSPEQARGDRKQVGVQSDVWGLGATLYYVLTRQPPFDGSSISDVLFKICSVEPDRPRKLDAGISEDAETVCLKALEKDLGKRYAGAGDFAKECDRLIKGERIHARPIGSLARLFRKMRRHRVLLGAVAAAVLVTAAAAWFGLSSASRTRAFREAKAEAEQAYADGNWIRAQSACERARRIRADPQMESIAEGCRRRLGLQAKVDPLLALIRDTRPLLYAQGIDIRRQLERVEAAVEELETLLAHEDFAPGWKAAGIGWYFIGDAARAEKALLRAEKLAPADGEVHFNLARIYLERSLAQVFSGLDDAASNETRKELWAMSGDWVLKALPHLERFSDSEEGIHRHLGKTYRALAERRWKEVLLLCDEGLRLFASEMGAEEFWVLRGRQSIAEEAIPAYGKALEIRPHYAWALFLRAGEYHRTKDLNRSDQDTEAVIALNPRFAPALNNRGSRRWERNDMQGAKSDFDAALRLDPDFAEALFNRGRLLHRQGDSDSALLDYEAALRIRPRAPGLYNERGMLWYDKREWARAMEDFARAIEIDPRRAASHFNRGNARRERGDPDGAISDYDRALEINPRFADARVNRGILRAERDLLDGAITDFTVALEMDSTLRVAYLWRGQALVAKGQYDAAIRDLSRSMELGPPDGRAFLYRGMASAGLKKFSEAIADYTRAIDLSPAWGVPY